MKGKEKGKNPFWMCCCAAQELIDNRHQQQQQSLQFLYCSGYIDGDKMLLTCWRIKVKAQKDEIGEKKKKKKIHFVRFHFISL